MPPRLSTATASPLRANTAAMEGRHQRRAPPPAARSRLRRSATTSMPVRSASSARVVQLQRVAVAVELERLVAHGLAVRADAATDAASTPALPSSALHHLGVTPRHGVAGERGAVAVRRCRRVFSASSSRRSASSKGRCTAPARTRTPACRRRAQDPPARHRPRRARCPTSGRCCANTPRPWRRRSAAASSWPRICCATPANAGARRAQRRSPRTTWRWPAD